MKTNRRNFLRTSFASASLAAFGATVPRFLATVASAKPADSRDTILVVIQLSGGNDGLNTVVPFLDDEYHRARPTLRLTAKQVHKLEGGLGLHPEMSALHRLFSDGSAGVALDVAVPNGSRNHESALRAWQTAEPDEASRETGWIGRAGDAVSRVTPGAAAGSFVGSIAVPFTLHAERAVLPSFATLKDYLPTSTSGYFSTVSRITPPAGEADDLLAFVRRTTAEACTVATRLERVARNASSSASRYPQQFPLAGTLHTIAQLIRADTGLRIYCAELGGGGIGGFDTHAGQAANHGALLRELSECLAAFTEDLRRDHLLDRVLVMTYSEFGRTLEENGRHGTNHGLAAPVFLVGGGCKPGVIGQHRSLKSLDAGGVPCRMDFRHMYAALLDRWLGYDSRAILGRQFPAADILGRARS